MINPICAEQSLFGLMRGLGIDSSSIYDNIIEELATKGSLRYMDDLRVELIYNSSDNEYQFTVLADRETDQFTVYVHKMEYTPQLINVKKKSLLNMSVIDTIIEPDKTIGKWTLNIHGRQVPRKIKADLRIKKSTWSV